MRTGSCIASASGLVAGRQRRTSTSAASAATPSSAISGRHPASRAARGSSATARTNPTDIAASHPPMTLRIRPGIDADARNAGHDTNSAASAPATVTRPSTYTHGLNATARSSPPPLCPTSDPASTDRRPHTSPARPAAASTAMANDRPTTCAAARCPAVSPRSDSTNGVTAACKTGVATYSTATTARSGPATRGNSCRPACATTVAPAACPCPMVPLTKTPP